MCENYHGANYELAKAEADKVDKQIIEALREGHSFRVEAGAGSGKTYSLNRVIDGYKKICGLNIVEKSKM